MCIYLRPSHLCWYAFWVSSNLCDSRHLAEADAGDKEEEEYRAVGMSAATAHLDLCV